MARKKKTQRKTGPNSCDKGTEGGLINPMLPTVFADNVTLTARNDGMCVIQWMSTIPAGPGKHMRKEECRVIVSQAQMHSILDVFCQITGYYPKKPRATAKRK